MVDSRAPVGLSTLVVDGLDVDRQGSVLAVPGAITSVSPPEVA
jgi:hypothetical protein